MDTRLWIGVLAGVAGTFLVLGGLAAVTATAGGMGPMSMGGMDGMMDQCQQMMDEHDHEHQGGHEHGNNTAQDRSSRAMTPPATGPADPMPSTGSVPAPW